MRLNGEEVAALRCTPENLEELGVGHLVSSGFLRSGDEIRGVQVSLDYGIIIVVRALVDRAKGVDAPHSQGRRRAAGPKFRGASLLGAMEGLVRRGEIFRRTGGTHFAGLVGCEDSGAPEAFFEDIGRYNAIDKAVGSAVLGKRGLGRVALAVSCRVSSDVVTKAAVVGIPLIVSRAGPTSEAVNLAEREGVTLVGFARGQRMNVYTCEERVV